ncbi:MAG: AAA family ATPase [Clostridia bacterium]|nr:AAA family ATPase [Clostridia bacterium]
MNKLIAVTGKGGVGKTTVCALLVKNLLAAGRSPVLAIDADPNSCLDAALGVRATGTVGRAREEARGATASGAAASISKRELLRLKIEQNLVEAKGFDLIAMGRPEGAGCYCYANNVLKEVIAEISAQYPYVVLDNEAGLENLSRRIVRKVDMMVLVSDASNAGLQTLLRLHELAGEMEMAYGRLALVINRVRSGKLPDRMAEIERITKADIVVGLPNDEEIAIFSEESKNFLEISDSNPAYQSIGTLI